MNRAEWRTGTDPLPMLKAVQTTQSRRKARLFACACCRRLWPLLPPDSRAGVDAAERFADGHLARSELEAAHARANAAVMALPPRDWSYEVLRTRFATSAAAECSSRRAGAISVASTAADAAALAASCAGPVTAFAHTRDLHRVNERAAQAGLVREIFGHPSGVPGFSPDWRTDTVTELARQMYEAGEFSAMPILADALQDAGCDDEDVLDHCRGGGWDADGPPHVRGCWVVDLVLDRAAGPVEYHLQNRGEHS